MPLKQVLPVAATITEGDGASQEQIDQIAALANNAQTVAQAASTAATTAGTKADAAKTAADGYSAQITAAGTKADNAKSAADAAAAAASTASSKADAVTSTAAAAQTTANTAKTTADTAKSTADGAKATADGLSAQVTAAGTKADNAKTAADSAAAAATTAGTKADTAKTAADNAVSVANGFGSRISDLETIEASYTEQIAGANATANQANSAAQNAIAIANDLDDSIDAAVAKADTALSTANGVDAKATAAQTAANNANTNASTALTTANATATQAGDLSTQVTNLSNSVTLIGQKATDAQTTANAASATASQLDDRIDAHDSRLDEVDTRLDALESSTGGGTGPAYDDTAITGRVSTLETDNTTNKANIATLQAASAAAGAAIPMEYLSVWGDSRTAQNWNSAGNAILARGYGWWAECLSGRVRMHLKYNFGVSGDSIQQLLDRMNNDTANASGVKPSQVPPSHAVLHIGTNSINAGTTVASCMYQLNLCITWLLNKGHTVYVVSEWPRGLTATGNAMLTADNQKIMYGYAREVRKLGKAKKVKIIDVWPAMADPTLSTAQPRLNYLNGDGLHPSIGAGFLTGKLIAKALEENNAHKIAFPPGSQDLYDATSNKEGSLSPNPMLRGTAGVVSATGASGTAPDSWTLTPTTGMTAVGSQVIVTMPDGTKREAQRIVISGTPAANGSVYLRIPNTTRANATGVWYGKINDGDIIEGWAEIMVSDGFTNMSNVTCNIAADTTALSALGGTYTSGGTTGDLQWPDNLKQAFSAVIRSPELVVGASHTTFQFEVRAYFLEAIASSLTIDILSAGMRKKTPLA